MKTLAKVLAVVMALVLVISLAACGSNDSKKDEKKDDAPAATEAATEAPAPTIVGTWESNDAPGTYYVFNEDGTGTIESSGISFGFTYTDKGDSIVVASGDDATQKMTYKYTVDGENLTLTEEESGTELKYKKVEAVPTEAADPNATENGSKLVGDWEGEQNGVTVVYTFNANGTGVMKGGSATVNFTYTDDGSNVTLSTDGEGSTAPYTIEGDTLKVTPEDSEEFTLTRKQ